VEIQFNLLEMVAIKGGSGTQSGAGGEAMVGGHDAFNLARVLDTFNARSLKYSGNPTEDLWQLIAAGGLTTVVLDNVTITEAQLVQLANAMASTQCRVKALSLKGCTGATTIPGGLLVHLQEVGRGGGAELDLRGWFDLQAVPDALGELTELNTLNLYDCRQLKMLPDALGKLTMLTSLNLSSCRALQTLPDTLGGLTQLTNLALAGCRTLETLPDALGECINLETLHLGWCEKLTALPPTITQLTKLTALHVKGCTSLAEPLPDLSHLMPGWNASVAAAKTADRPQSRRPSGASSDEWDDDEEDD
jgi:Leucine-rich repeat (LRR) protein